MGGITPEELYQVRYVRGGLSCARARALVGVSRRTWSRWERGEARIPTAAVNLLRLVAAGELPAGGPAWNGWRFYKGELVSPEGIGFEPGEIRALPLQYAYIAELECQLRNRPPTMRQAARTAPHPLPWDVGNKEKILEHRRERGDGNNAYGDGQQHPNEDPRVHISPG
jgi:transcriptional regulator with XRE-family HTH domain